MKVIKHYNVFIQPPAGAEFFAGVAHDSALPVINGFLMFNQKDNGGNIAFNVHEIVWYRLEPEYSDHASKNA